jgi:hypothetical protein
MSELAASQSNDLALPSLEIEPPDLPSFAEFQDLISAYELPLYSNDDDDSVGGIQLSLPMAQQLSELRRRYRDPDDGARPTTNVVSLDERRLLAQASADDVKAQPTFGPGLTDRLERFYDFWARREPPHAALWTWVGISISALICVSISLGSWIVAASLLLIRVTGSLFFGGGPAAFRAPLDPVAAHETNKAYANPNRAVWVCLSSHLCDAAICLSASWYLLGLNQTYGFIGTVCTAALLAGTLARIAPAQVGIVSKRSPWERPIRLGGISLGLLTAALGAPAVGAFITTAVAGTFGLFEIVKASVLVNNNSIMALHIVGYNGDGAVVSNVTYRESGADVSNVTYEPVNPSSGSSRVVHASCLGR